MLRRLIPFVFVLAFGSHAYAEDGSGAPGTIPAPAASATPDMVPVAATEPTPNNAATPALPKKAEALPNPAEHPVLAWNDAKLARKTSWPLAIWAVLAMLGKLLAYGADKLKNVQIIGGLAKWLGKGKHAMIVAGIGAVGAAGYNTLIEGGTLVAALVASGVAIAGILHSTTHAEPAKPS